MSSEGLRVLMSAYACEPGRGSEPGAGWAWARAAAQHHEVWLMTRANNATRIEEALAGDPGLNLRPVYLDLPSWARWWKRGGRGVRTYYMLWQLLAWFAARRLHRRIRFDVAHHLTFATDWLPSAVGYLPGCALVWGPVGGACPPPWRLWKWLGVRGLVKELMREGLTRPLRTIFGNAMARRAALIVAQNDDVRDRFEQVGTVVVEPNVAVESGAVYQGSNSQISLDRTPRCRAIFVGRLVPLKGLRLALAALARPEAQGWTLDVIGEGPELEPCRRLAARRGVLGRVRFFGQLPRKEVFAEMQEADALLLPSLHDAAGWAVAEAMVHGLPVVCLDRGGPSVLVRHSGGKAVPVRGDVVKQLAVALNAPKGQPDGQRWTADRLPSLLSRWYGVALSR